MHCTLLRELFLQRLPMVLASADETISLENPAALADKIAEVSSPAISGIAKPKVTSEVSELRAEVTKLQEAIKSLSLHSKPSSHLLCSFRRCSPSLARSRSPASATLCWYHQQYWDRAQKCINIPKGMYTSVMHCPLALTSSFAMMQSRNHCNNSICSST